MVTISLLLMPLIACNTTKETVKLVYIYPTIMEPSIDSIPEIPERNTYTVEEYPDAVLFPKDELDSLGLYILEMQRISSSLREKLLYYIEIVASWKGEQVE